MSPEFRITRLEQLTRARPERDRRAARLSVPELQWMVELYKRAGVDVYHERGEPGEPDPEKLTQPERDLLDCLLRKMSAPDAADLSPINAELRDLVQLVTPPAPEYQYQKPIGQVGVADEL